MNKSFLDMARPLAVYVGGIGVLLLVAVAAATSPAVSLSHYLSIPYKAKLCAALFQIAGVFGALTIHRHIARAKTPWKVPLSQVTYSYLGFWGSLALALLLFR